MATSDYTHLQELPDEKLEETIAASSQTPTLVYFGATWCAPCKTYAPVVDHYAGTTTAVTSYGVDVDDSPLTGDHFKTQILPTTLLLVDGNVVWRRQGPLSEEDLAAQVATAIAGASTAIREHKREDMLKTGRLPDALPAGVSASLRIDYEPRDLEPGQSVALAEGEELVLTIDEDPLAPNEYELEWIDTFPRLLISEVYLNCVDLNTAALERILALSPLGMTITLQNPLPSTAIPVLAHSSLDFVTIDAPGFAPDELSAAAKGLTINGEVGVENSAPAPTVAWTQDSELQSRINSGERFVVIVQAEHPARTADLAPYAERLGEDTVFVSGFGSGFVTATFPLGWFEDPIAFGVENGEIRWRAPLPDDESEDHAAELAAHWDIAGENALTAIEFHGDQTFVPGGADDPVSLSTERGVSVGKLRPGAESVTTPAGWRSRREAYVEQEELEHGEISQPAGVDEFAIWLQFNGSWDASALQGSESVSILHLYGNDDITGINDALATFPRLRMLIVQTMSDHERASVRAAHPDLIINGAWPE